MIATDIPAGFGGDLASSAPIGREQPSGVDDWRRLP
jgi:hypothetical protein